MYHSSFFRVINLLDLLTLTYERLKLVLIKTQVLRQYLRIFYLVYKKYQDKFEGLKGFLLYMICFLLSGFWFLRQTFF